MFGIFNRMFRNTNRTDKWNPPEHWQHYDHLSTFDRQRIAAEKQREKLARDAGLF